MTINRGNPLPRRWEVREFDEFNRLCFRLSSAAGRPIDADAVLRLMESDPLVAPLATLSRLVALAERGDPLPPGIA